MKHICAQKSVVGKLVAGELNARAGFVAVFCGCVLLFGQVACQGNNSSSTLNQSSTEAQAFQRNCAVCHKPDGSGQILNGVQVPSLRAGKAVGDADDYLYQQIEQGGGGMPAFAGVLSKSEIKQLVTYIRRDLQQTSSKP